MSKLFNAIKVGFKETIAHDQGKLDLRSELIEIPQPPAQYKAADIKKIREMHRYSQGLFARVLNVSIKTVQSWETGHRSPNRATLRLLEIIEKGIYLPLVQRKN